MKRVLSLLVTTSLLFAACEVGSKTTDEPSDNPVEQPTEKSPVLTLSTQEIIASPEGEELIIGYTIENPKEGVNLVAECDVEWISDIVIDQECITLKVAANEESKRNAVVTISYDAIIEEVRIVQSSLYGLNFNATIFSGDFYHAETLYWNAHNYYFILSDAVIDRNNPVPNSTYFYFDLYSEVETEDNSIPCGTYMLDPESQWLAGTLNGGKTYGFTINASGNDYGKKYLFTEGELVVSERKIEGKFVCENGTKVRVCYEGDHQVTPHYRTISTISRDVNLNITGAAISANNYGEYFAPSSNNWTVRIYEDTDKKNGVFIQLELLADPSASWQRLYTALEDDSLTNPEDYINTFIKGTLNNNQIAGSWYAVLKNGSIDYDMAPIVKGSIDIVNNADGTNSFTFDCLDDAGHKITGYVTNGAN